MHFGIVVVSTCWWSGLLHW